MVLYKEDRLARTPGHAETAAAACIGQKAGKAVKATGDLDRTVGAGGDAGIAGDLFHALDDSQGFPLQLPFAGIARRGSELFD
jgi:hypothetical protein